MKKYIKYVVSGLTFFTIMTLFNYLFDLNIKLIINITSTLIYVVLSIICDYFFKKQFQRELLFCAIISNEKEEKNMKEEIPEIIIDENELSEYKWISKTEFYHQFNLKDKLNKFI